LKTGPQSYSFIPLFHATTITTKIQATRLRKCPELPSPKPVRFATAAYSAFSHTEQAVHILSQRSKARRKLPGFYHPQSAVTVRECKLVGQETRARETAKSPAEHPSRARAPLPKITGQRRVRNDSVLHPLKGDTAQLRAPNRPSCFASKASCFEGSHQLHCPCLDVLQHLKVLLVVRGPKLNTGVEVRPQQCRAQGPDACPAPAGHTIADTGQAAVGLLGHPATLLAQVQPATKFLKEKLVRCLFSMSNSLVLSSSMGSRNLDWFHKLLLRCCLCGSLCSRNSHFLGCLLSLLGHILARLEATVSVQIGPQDAPSCSTPSQADGSTTPQLYEILRPCSNFLNGITTPSWSEWPSGMLQWPGKGDGMLGASCREAGGE